MTVRFPVVLAAFVVLVPLGPSASARPAAGDAAGGAPGVQGSNPLACSVTVVADRLTRCDYLVAYLPATA